MITSSKISSPSCCSNFKCHKRLIKSRNVPWVSNRIPMSFHTSRTLSQSQKIWPPLSGSKPHTTHRGSSVIFLRYKLSFVDILFLLALQANDLTLFGIWSCHKFYQFFFLILHIGWTPSRSNIPLPPLFCMHS